MVETSDIVIIGAGIAGTSAAAALAPHATVTVLERETQPGTQSTGRSAAVFILNYGNATLRALNALAYPALAGNLVGDSLLAPRGELLVANETTLSALDAYLDGAEGMERLSPSEAQELVPVLRRDRVVAAAYEPQALTIDVDRLMQGLTRKITAHGGQILTDAPVTKLAQQSKGWRVDTPQGPIACHTVINAAGAWVDQIATLAGVRPVGIQPLRRSAVIMPVDADVNRWPLFASAAEDWYAKPESTGLMISPADEDLVPPQDAYPDDMVIAEGLYRFEHMVDLPIRRPSHSWAGLRNFVPDRTPVCGFDPDATGFFWLAGQGGYGVQTAPALADITAALCLGNPAPVPPHLLEALSPTRLRTKGN